MSNPILVVGVSFAGNDYDLRVFEDKVPGEKFYRVETVLRGEVVGFYYLRLDRETETYRFPKGVMPYGLKTLESSLSDAIVSHHNKHSA